MADKALQVEISLYASKLKNTAGAFKGRSDPYAVVTLLAGNPSEKPEVLGKTEVIENQLSPAWTTTFTASYTFGKIKKFNVGVFDEVKAKTNKAMGSTVFEIGEILSSRGNIKAKRLKNGGTVFCRIKEKKGGVTGTLLLSLKGMKLKNVDGLLSKSNPFFVVSKQTDDAGGFSWQPVHRSPVVKSDLNPVWETCSISLQKLCDGDNQRPILIEVKDWGKNGKHKPMGRFESSVNGLLSAVGATMPLCHKGKQKYGGIFVERAYTTGDSTHHQNLTSSGGPVHDSSQKYITVNGIKKLNPNYKQSASGAKPATTGGTHSTSNGSYISSAPDQETWRSESSLPSLPEPLLPPGQSDRPGFVDYISGGAEISLMVAIDYTGSNGDPRIPGTLHYNHRDGQLNDYEKAMTAVGTVVGRYDSDKKFPVLGFGAKYNGRIRHCFQVGNAPELDGIKGMLEAYRGVFHTGLTMSGPTVFAEVIDYAANKARKTQAADRAVGKQQYFVLQIITDGAVTDIEETKTAIRNASSAPLSIVIVGVGSEDFSKMQFLDDFHRTEGSTRDICQFVEFNRYKHDKEALTRATLDEIPDQLVDYFQSQGIPPLPPIRGSQVSLIAVDDFNEEEDVDLSLSLNTQGQLYLSDPTQATWDAHTYERASFFLPPPIPPPGTATGAYVSTAPTVPSTSILHVRAPENSYPGMQLQIQNPKTMQLLTVQVPADVKPGVSFPVRV